MAANSAGWINSADEHDGILVYTFETNNFERITDFGSRPIWLHDSRRLLFRDAGKLFLVNSETKKVQEISLHSPNPVIEYGLTATTAPSITHCSRPKPISGW